jgi:hypothetical protein
LRRHGKGEEARAKEKAKLLRAAEKEKAELLAAAAKEERKAPEAAKKEKERAAEATQKEKKVAAKAEQKLNERPPIFIAYSQTCGHPAMPVKWPNCGHPAGGAADPAACPTSRPCCCNLRSRSRVACCLCS